ncbi:MAG: NAD(P)/FAD-dependent oxidoreductase, partial [Acidimicrobiia bacterium]
MADWDAALAAADVRVLLMSVFHLTGDERWLADPYRPARDVRLVADPEAGFPPAVATEIRSVARDLLKAGAEPVVTDPDPELFGRMMSWCLGEEVPPEYVPMMRTDLGFADGDVHWTDGPPPDLDLDVLVIGAGVSGLCLAAKLDRLGIPVRVVERRDSVGGTWRDNRYPGCGVDTPNHFYSYSFAPNPHWRHYFSPREEIEVYLADCADRLGVADLVTLGTEVTEARWDEASARWQVALRGPDGDTTTSAAVLVAAAGHFGSPNEVALPGLDEFAGRSFHTARWPDDVDVTGRRVAVVGTGASAMQVVPEIAPIVDHLTVFQRTAQWARHVPLYDAAVDPDAHRLFEAVPYYDRWYRFAQAWRYGDGLLRFLRKDPDWPHPERSLNRTNDRHRREMTDHLLAELDGRPDLVAKCLPDYPPFGKRILIDNGWFRTL